MGKANISWQGVGIASKPRLAREPLSLHMLRYLLYGSESATEHIVIVGDSMQRHNYCVLYGLDEKKAFSISRKKGRAKSRDLRRVCRAYDLNNIEVKCWSDMQNEAQDVREFLEELIERDDDVRKKVFDTIPERMKQGLTAEQIRGLCNYTLDEIALALSLGELRISHPKQKQVDELTQDIQERFHLGKTVRFDYPAIGLEYEPATGFLIEPYSAFDSEKRLLVTDSRREFDAKLEGLTARQRRKLLEKLRVTWNGAAENQDSFYELAVRPGWENIVNRPARIFAGLQHAAAVVYLAATLGLARYNSSEKLKEMKTDYGTIPYEEFVLKYERQLPPNFQGIGWIKFAYRDEFPPYEFSSSKPASQARD